jgi:pimeloyl-ACP methyl ester carboxylesterase
MLARGDRLCRYGEAAARYGVARVVSALSRSGALTPARIVVTIVSRGRLRREDEGVLAPIWKLSPETRRILGDMWTQPKFFNALGSQIGHICASAEEVVRESSGDFGDLPLVVITAADADPRRMRADAELASRSTRGRHVLAPSSGHWVPLDAPQVVIDAISEVVGGRW